MSTVTPQYETFTGYSPASEPGPYRAADYLDLPEGERVELIRGRLIMSPCPTPLHQVILSVLDRTFAKVEQQTGGLFLLSPMDVLLSDDTILQPDLLFVRKERRDIVTKHVEGPCDLAVEILSPGTSRRDRTEKLDLYAKYGVPEYWIVDPDAQLFECLLLKNGEYTIQQQPDDHYRSPRLPEIEIDLAAFWAEVQRRLPQS